MKWFAKNRRNIIYFLQFHMIGIVSNENPRRLWTQNFGFVDADECQLNLVAPNVPFNCAVEVDLHYGRDEGSMDFCISSFKPEFIYALHSFLSVVMDYEVVYQAVEAEILDIVILIIFYLAVE